MRAMEGAEPGRSGDATVDYSDFGRYLSQQRELRGMSREQVAEATKIPVALIAALETGQLERLPGRVFVLNYIKAYARVIGLEADDVMLRYEEVERVPDDAVAERPTPGRRGRRLRLALFSALGAGAGVLTWLLATGKLH